MATTKFTSQLVDLAKKLERVVESVPCSCMHPTKSNYRTIEDLGARLFKAVAKLSVEIEALKKRRTESAHEEGKQRLNQAQKNRKDTITSSNLKNRGIFAKNIALFFSGPKDSVIDSDATRIRKQVTRERCERICSLSPNGIISWAAAFNPTVWTANLMSRDTFDFVVERIDPEDIQVWPSDVYHILNGLGTEEPLRESQKYHEFLKGKVYFSENS